MVAESKNAYNLLVLLYLKYTYLQYIFKIREMLAEKWNEEQLPRV